MSIQDRVTKVVTQWSQVTDFGTSESLQVIWGQGPLKDSISFPTPALLNLITMLQHEFQSGKDARDLHGLSASRFKPATNGTIDTVDQLSSVVLHSPEGTGGPAMMALPMTADAHRFFVNSIADEVEKRLRPANLRVPSSRPSVSLRFRDLHGPVIALPCGQGVAQQFLNFLPLPQGQ